jgi:hypothetical protein
MKPPNARNRIEEQRQAVEKILEERFPVRGWVLEKSVTTDAADHRWPLYKEVPRTNEEGLVVEAEILEYLLAAEFTFTARFKLANDAILLSNLEYLKIPPEAVEKQFLTFEDTRGAMVFTLNAKAVGTYTTRTVVPEIHALHDAIDRWVGKRDNSLSPAEKKQSLFVIGELAAVRQNSLGAMQTALGTLLNLVRSKEPDYWLLVEGLATGRIEPQEAVEKSKGAITVTVTEKYGELRAAYEESIRRGKDTATRQ